MFSSNTTRQRKSSAGGSSPTWVCSVNNTGRKQKRIFAALETATPTKEGADVTVDGETIHIPADLFEVRDEIVDVRGEEIVPHVIEPSYGIDRMCYACTRAGL